MQRAVAMAEQNVSLAVTGQWAYVISASTEATKGQIQSTAIFGDLLVRRDPLGD